MDMEEDIFADQPYGKVALQKMSKSGPVPEGFRLFCAGWLGDKPEEWEVMKVTGAEFRRAKSGPNKGKLCVMVQKTTRTVYVTKTEMDEIKKAA